MSDVLQVPASKSMTQRALLIAALGPRPTRIDNALVCDDSRHLSTGLRALGCQVRWQGTQVHITPAPLHAPRKPVHLGNAGTAVRFTACTSLLLDGPITLDGDSYMRTRPIAPLVEALAQLGVDGRYHGRSGCPPLTLSPAAQLNSRTSLDGSLSSQYLSGLLMVAPRLPSGLHIEVTGRAVSQPYVHMTAAMMRSAGAQLSQQGRSWIVQPGGYPQIGETFPHAVEGDWSAAAFVLVGQRLIDDHRPITGIEPSAPSLQGDAVIARWLERLDQQPENRFDLSDTPDLIAPITAAALFAKNPTVLDHIAHARVKECDRVAVLARELSRIGARIDIRGDAMHIAPLTESQRRAAPDAKPIALDPEHDHRMAMTFGIVSLLRPDIEVRDPQCVSKSFEDFWQQLEILRHAAPTS